MRLATKNANFKVRGTTDILNLPPARHRRPAFDGIKRAEGVRVARTTRLGTSCYRPCSHDKCTGAVVSLQPFGSGRASRTNDTACSIDVFYRYVSACSIKESIVRLGLEYLVLQSPVFTPCTYIRMPMKMR